MRWCVNLYSGKMKIESILPHSFECVPQKYLSCTSLNIIDIIIHHVHLLILYLYIIKKSIINVYGLSLVSRGWGICPLTPLNLYVGGLGIGLWHILILRVQEFKINFTCPSFHKIATCAVVDILKQDLQNAYYNIYILKLNIQCCQYYRRPKQNVLFLKWLVK